MADLEPPVVTVINRQKIIEAAATAIHDAACTFHSDRGISVGHYSIEMHAAQDAALVLPVIVAAALKPIRELHVGEWDCTNPRHTNPVVVCPECCEFCTHCGADMPCDTTRLLDQIETDARGGE